MTSHDDAASLAEPMDFQHSARLPASARVLWRCHFLLLCVALLAAGLRAEVRLPPVFGDHMVLQRDRPLPVWGDANPGERIRVEFAGQTVDTTADGAGRWRVNLPAQSASADGRNLVVRGSSEARTFSDVLVGEVWFCSGQSNMEKPLGPRRGQKPTDDYEAELARSSCATLRLFQMPLSGDTKGNTALKRWLVCDAPALMDTSFSAAAYYFGRELTRELGVPVGLIHSSFGGTRIEAWMPKEAFAADPALRGLETEKYDAWVPGVQPTELYTTMVTPFVPYALRGFLWYQGETNCMNAEGMIYATKMRALIASWRGAWQDNEAPFYYALIAPFAYSAQKKWAKQLTPEALPLLWEAQIAALDVPHTGIITTTDIAGNVHDIHPTNKRDVGLRYARLALAQTYGRKDVAALAPKIEAHRRRWLSNKIEVRFANATGLRSRDGKPLSHFEVAGADRTFVPANAAITGDDRVTVSSPEVKKPVAVRFAWNELANPNLVNAAGLPALPFRTDTWPVVAEVPKK